MLFIYREDESFLKSLKNLFNCFDSIEKRESFFDFYWIRVGVFYGKVGD